MLIKIDVLIICMMLTALFPSQGMAALVNPIDGYTVRSFNGGTTTYIVGGESVAPLSFLEIKPDTEDRIALIFDLQGQTLSSDTIYLNFYMHSRDAPNYTTIRLHSFYTDTIRSSSHFNSIGNEIATFSDFGAGAAYASMNTSLDVTTVFNEFLMGGSGYLGFILYGDSDTDPTTDARYVIDLRSLIALSTDPLAAYEPPPPPPPPAVPLPGAIWLMLSGLAVLGLHKGKNCS